MFSCSKRFFVQFIKYSNNYKSLKLSKYLENVRPSSSAVGAEITEEQSEDLVINKEENKMKLTIEDITKGDKELEHKLKVIMLETEVSRQDGLTVPENDFLTPEMWKELLNSPSRASRLKYLTFLFKVEKKKENRMEKKLLARKLYEESVAGRDPEKKHLPIEEHALTYGLMHNNIFLRVHDTTMNHLYHKRLFDAMQFGQKLIIDCGYDQDMTKMENSNAAKQLMLLFADNRISKDPYDLHFVNANKQGELIKYLHKFIPTMYNKEFPLSISESSYLDLFPKNNLIYLTPHCKEEMTKYDHDAIYIIGGIVDKLQHLPLSLAKGKREGITMKKFPLDRYLQWGGGSGKSLTINQCVLILLDLKETGDWKYALRHVPKRKIVENYTNTKNTLRGNWKPKRNERLFPAGSITDH